MDMTRSKQRLAVGTLQVKTAPRRQQPPCGLQKGKRVRHVFQRMAANNQCGGPMFIQDLFSERYSEIIRHHLDSRGLSTSSKCGRWFHAQKTRKPFFSHFTEKSAFIAADFHHQSIRQTTLFCLLQDPVHIRRALARSSPFNFAVIPLCPRVFPFSSKSASWTKFKSQRSARRLWVG